MNRFFITDLIIGIKEAHEHLFKIYCPLVLFPSISVVSLSNLTLIQSVFASLNSKPNNVHHLKKS